MKVLLIRPRVVEYLSSQSAESFEGAIGLVPPLGLAYLAASLERESHKVAIMDCQALGLGPQEIRKEILKESPQVVGISAMTTNIRGALESARIAKECKAITVIGGPHMMIFPKETLSYEFIDYGIGGEGEYVLNELLLAIEKKGGVSDIKGLIYRENERIIVNEPAIVDDLDQLPIPAYHLLPLERYEMVNTGNKLVSLITIRGCPYKCGFCYRSPISRIIRKRDPLKVVDEIEYFYEKYGIKEINFVNESITLGREHLKRICQEILKRNLKINWQSPARVDQVTEELLRLMKESGCQVLRFGVESGNQNILDIIDKRTTLSQIETAFSLCNKIGIETVAYFIIGYLGETEETIKETIALARKISPTYATFFPATPMPQTSLFAFSVQAGLVEGDYWRDFTLGKRNDSLPFLFPGAGEWVVKAYRSLYFRPSYILKSLKKINSWKNLKKYSLAAWALLKMKFKRRKR
ncbi:MAG: radical SAM protein [bacterium]